MVFSPYLQSLCDLTQLPFARNLTLSHKRHYVAVYHTHRSTKHQIVPILDGITTPTNLTSTPAGGRPRRNGAAVRDGPPRHPVRFEHGVCVAHTPSRSPALCCLRRCRWSIVASFDTTDAENKSECIRGRSNLSAASPPTLAEKRTPIPKPGSPCPGDPFPISPSYRSPSRHSRTSIPKPMISLGHPTVKGKCRRDYPFRAMGRKSPPCV